MKNAPKMIMAQQRAAASDSDSDSSDDSSGEGGSERANSFDWLFLLSCESKPIFRERLTPFPAQLE